jgi:hypothetical protein
MNMTVQLQKKHKFVHILICGTWELDCVSLSAEYTAVEKFSKEWHEEKSTEQEPDDTITATAVGH